jgi:hypothetical protein
VELYNCNAFVADIANFMSLKVPSSSWIYPKVFVSNVRKDEGLFVGAQSKESGMPHFALTSPLSEFYLTYELGNKPRGRVLVLHFLVERRRSVHIAIGLGARRICALSMCAWYMRSSLAAIARPMMVRKLGMIVLPSLRAT